MQEYDATTSVEIHDSIHILQGHQGRVYVVDCIPTTPTLVAIGGEDNLCIFVAT